MPQTCSICKHPKRDAIEQAIRAGDSLRNIAEQFGTKYQAVNRHKPHMVSEVATLAPAVIQAKQSKAADIVDELYDLKTTLGSALGTAVESGNIIAIAAMSRELRGVMDSLIKIAIAQKEIEAQKHKEISDELEAWLQEIIA